MLISFSCVETGVSLKLVECLRLATDPDLRFKEKENNNQMYDNHRVLL
jgi:hypothetical protein